MNGPAFWHRVKIDAEVRGIADRQSDKYEGLFLAIKSLDPIAEIEAIRSRYVDPEILASLDHTSQHAQRFARPIRFSSKLTRVQSAEPKIKAPLPVHH
jgi:hypothetical protein